MVACLKLILICLRFYAEELEPAETRELVCIAVITDEGRKLRAGIIVAEEFLNCAGIPCTVYDRC